MARAAEAVTAGPTSAAPGSIGASATSEGPAGSRDRADRTWVALAAASVCLWQGLQLGRVHPDEVFQFLEPANRLALGYGWTSWEWVDGLRNWAIPGALAAGVKVVDLLGWKTPWGHRFGVSLVLAALTFPCFLAAVRYGARRLGDDDRRATRLAVLALVILWGPCTLYLGRTLGESIGALFGMAAIEALDRPGGRRSDAAWAGAWVGLAILTRYSFGVLLLALALQLAWQRRWVDLIAMGAGGLPLALGLGAIDWATWGAPFHSLLGYVGFNTGHHAADRFGSQPWSYYARVLGWLPWPLLAGLRWIDRRPLRCLFPCAGYLVALIATPHKEERFLFPVVLWLSAELAPGFVRAVIHLWNAGSLRRLAARGILLVFTLASAVVYLTLLRGIDSDLLRATITVGEDPATTGLLVAGDQGRWGSGGDFYLGRPMSAGFGMPGDSEFAISLRNPKVNRVIVMRGVSRDALSEAGFGVIREQSAWNLAILGR